MKNLITIIAFILGLAVGALIVKSGYYDLFLALSASFVVLFILMLAVFIIFKVDATRQNEKKTNRQEVIVYFDPETKKRQNEPIIQHGAKVLKY